MGALDVLAEVRRLGGDVKVVGPDRLRVLAPPALLHDLVERVRAVKPVLLAVLTGLKNEPDHTTTLRTTPKSDADEWRARHAEALEFWGAFHPADEATPIAWGEIESRWHRQHGARVAPAICAGCGEPIGDVDTLPLGDGARVHIATLDCLIGYGKHWRAGATRALTAMGLIPPARDEGS